MSNPNIFEYRDYRQYLHEVFEWKKSQDSRFSHRLLAHKLGFSSPNFILLVIQGKRNMGPSTLFKMAKYLKLNKKESAYFHTLVNFARAKTVEEKNAYYHEMLKLRGTHSHANIGKTQYEYYSKWYHPVIRELVVSPHFNGNFTHLGKCLSPRLSGARVKTSVELLLELGFIHKKGDKYVQADKTVSTGPEVQSLAVANFHRNMINLAGESYDRHRSAERSITSCTLHISSHAFQTLKKEIADLRKLAMELARQETRQEQVYQLNFQLFPVSQKQEHSK